MCCGLLCLAIHIPVAYVYMWQVHVQWFQAPYNTISTSDPIRYSVAEYRIYSWNTNQALLLTASDTASDMLVSSVQVLDTRCVCTAGALRQALLIGYDLPRMEGLWPSEKQCPGFKYAVFPCE